MFYSLYKYFFPKDHLIYSKKYNHQIINFYGINVQNFYLKTVEINALNVLKIPIKESVIYKDELFKHLEIHGEKKLLKWFKHCIGQGSSGHIYVLKTDHDKDVKVGKTKNPVKKRVKQLQTGNVNNIEILMEYSSCNHHLLEKIAHYVLGDYRSSKREYFRCNIPFIKNMVEITGNILNVLKNEIKETDSRQEIIKKIKNCLL
jgi:hypothetical protein